MHAGLARSEELGAGHPLRVEEALADDPGGVGTGAGLDLRPRDDAPEVGVQGGEPRGAVRYVGGASLACEEREAAEEEATRRRV